MPAVIEPLREEWSNAQAAALVLAGEGKLEPARDAVREFHRRLCQVRVLDPACGSGNFLYVTLEHMKRLEGEVLDRLESLGVSRSLETEGLTVDPHQFLGLELNPRAAAIAELVLWIGYLQWHFRTHGRVMPPQPVLRDFHNIECRDAVLAWDAVELGRDEQGRPVTRWDGRTTKKHPVTGEDVPDDTATVALDRYVNPRPAEWPAADFVVGNPPFIGNKRMRFALGDGYVEALRGAWTEMPDTADLVMFWWHHAATLARGGQLRRFGLITTNSLTQTFNRRVLGRHLHPSPTRSPDGAQRNPGANAPDSGLRPPSGLPPLRLAFAIPDHPWVDSADGAAVRIAMTVGEAAGAMGSEGRLLTVKDESQTSEDAVAVALTEKRGVINADLTVGANVAAASRLAANGGLSFQGMNLVGKGFRLTAEDVAALGYDVANLPPEIRPHCNARDMMQGGERCFVIDLFGYTAEEARQRHPALYQWLFDRVKPERDHNNRDSRRRNWWLFGEPVGKLRNAWNGLRRIILTPETAKHRVFAFVDLPFCPDHQLYAICTSDPLVLGVLSSIVHVTWALTAGATLEDRPRWRNVMCFEPFPFPAATPDRQARIRALAEELNAHRKRQQAAHPDLTLTGMYNVLEKLKAGDPLTAKEKTIHEQGLVSVLKTLHDDLDRAVLDAYGWNDLLPPLEIVNGNASTTRSTPTLALPLPGGGHIGSREDAKQALDDALLARPVALNAERAAEEARGLVRWLRREFQHPAAKPVQENLATEGEGEDAEKIASELAPTAHAKAPWPAALPEQVAAVAKVLAEARVPLDADRVAERFNNRGPWKKRLPQLLDTLVALGRARRVEGGFVAV